MFQPGFLFGVVSGGMVATDNFVPNLFAKGAARHVVCEIAQNAKDAVRTQRPDARASVTFRFTSQPGSHLEPFGVATAIDHAGACTAHDIGVDVGERDIRLLLIEDESGGLAGDAADPETPLGRYTFSVGTGVEGKSGSDNGRHGIGAGVGTAASMIRGMWFHTTRTDDTAVASARLSLSTRSIGGVRYLPEARLGILDEDGGWHGLLTGAFAGNMHAAFGFNRPVDVAGLSCAIVEPSADLDAPSIIAAVLAFQFVQVDAGAIEFRIVDDAAGIDVTISRETLAAVRHSETFALALSSARLGGTRSDTYALLSDFDALLSFIQAAGQVKDVPLIDLASPDAWTEAMRKAWTEGRIVSVGTKVEAEAHDGAIRSGEIGIHAKRVDLRRQGWDLLVRDGIVVPKRTAGRMTMVVSRGDEISVLLGDSEDPSHTKFTEPQARKRGWKNSAGTIKTFRMGGEIAAAALSAEKEGGDRLTLAAFFPRNGKDLDRNGRGGVASSTEDGDDGNAIFEPGDGRAEFFVHKADRRKAELVLTLSPQAREFVDGGSVLSIELDLDYAKARRGTGGFKESGVVIAVEGARESAVDGTVVRLFDVPSDIVVRYRNIDFNRDLVIEQTRISEDGENS